MDPDYIPCHEDLIVSHHVAPMATVFITLKGDGTALFLAIL
jgi:hypothetical protein